MKLPVKDPETIPWMSKRKIPAIKAALSAWRERRKDKAFVRHSKTMVDGLFSKGNVNLGIENKVRFVVSDLEELALIDDRLRRDKEHARA